MTTSTKTQVIELAKEMYMKNQAKHGFDGIADTQPEMLELIEEGYIEKAQESLQSIKETERALKKYEWYVESFNSKQLSTEKLKTETDISTRMTIPFDLTEAKDTGFFACGTSQSGKSTLCKHLIKQIVDAGYTVYVIDVSKTHSTPDSPIHNTIEIKEATHDMTIPSNVSTVLDVSALGYDDRFRFVNEFTRTLYNWHKAQGYKKAPFEFVFYEEAHTYLPNGCFRAARRYAPVVDLVTVGANFNLRFGAITQFPAALDKAVVKITQQRYFGWTTEFNDRNYIKSFVGKEHVDPKNPDSIFNLQKGQFLYQLRNKIEKIQSSPYMEPKPSFTLNGQNVNFGYIL